MFCPLCGSQIQDMSIFCSCCGGKISNYSNEVMANEKRELTECLGALEKTIFPLQQCENRSRAFEKERKKVKIFTGIWFRIILFIAACHLLGPIMRLYFDIWERIDINYIDNTMFYTYLFVVAIVWIVISIILIGVIVKCNKNLYKKKYIKYQEGIEADIRVALPILERYIPREYWYSEAVITILSYFRYSRANSIKEALNLYATESRMKKIENQQANIMQGVKDTNMILLLDVLSRL